MALLMGLNKSYGVVEGQNLLMEPMFALRSFLLFFKQRNKGKLVKDRMCILSQQQHYFLSLILIPTPITGHPTIPQILVPSIKESLDLNAFTMVCLAM